MGQRVAVIGAGPSGLAAARSLRQQGFEVVGFEIHDDVGGLWDIASPTSTLYESAHLISSARMTEFAEHPMRAGVPAYPDHREVAAYLRSYADRFDLRDAWHFGTRVVAARPTDPGWTIEVERDGTTHRHDVDAVVVATGTFHAPNLPEALTAFTGDVVHSSAYRSPDVLAGRRVLVVGCGNSGADIAVEAVHHAASVDLSTRRGYWFLPKFVAGRPIDTLGGGLSLPRALRQAAHGALVRALVGRPSAYGLPDPDHRMYESHPVLNTQVLHHLGHGDITPRPDVAAIDGRRVTFDDGTAVDYDVLLAATGYVLSYPFIDADLLHWRGAAPSLYLNTFPPDRDDLFMVGMVEASGLGFEGRMRQARLVAAYLRGRTDGTAAAQALHERIRAEHDQRLTGGFAYLELDRMAFYVSKEDFLARVDGHLEELTSPSGPGRVEIAAAGDPRGSR